MDNIYKKLDDIKDFINHNIKQGYINNNTTVGELLLYINNIKDKYLPLVECYKNLKCFKIGDLVSVSGEVFYGDSTYRVDCNGIIIERGSEMSLVNLDNIDGDNKVNVLVKNKYIYEL